MPEDWEFDPKYDIAVVRVPRKGDMHRFTVLMAEGLLTQEAVEREKIGHGDDVFMVGRFVDHDGGVTNRPAVRFGSISVMPAPIQQPNGGMADSFCIDLHCRNGYSGSPVYVYRTALYDLEERAAEKIEDAQFVIAGTALLVLLGIHFAQFPERWELEHEASPAAKEEAARVPLIREGSHVKGLSGMTCVLPAWRIREVLDLPKLKRHRDAADDREAERRVREGDPPEAETKAV